MLSDNGGGGESPAPSFAYTEAFNKAFPEYLAIGMTYDQFWNDDVDLVKAYRKAYRIKRDVRNHDLWLQGAYIYEALLDVSPIFHAFAKKGTKAAPYPERPFELYREPGEKASKENEKVLSKVRGSMEAIMVSINKKFEKKGGEGNG